MLAVTVHHIVNGPCITTLEYTGIDYSLAHKGLLLYLGYYITAVVVKQDYIVNVGTVADILIPLKAGTDKAFLTVDVELFVVNDNLGRFNVFEASKLCLSGILSGIIFLEPLEILN